MGLRVCLLLGSIGPSGGARVVAQHARGLARDHGMEVAIALWEPPEASQAIEGVSLLTVEEARAHEWDVAVATWWRTAYALFSLPARRHACFLQQFEERLYEPGDVERFGVPPTYSLPVAFLTEASWIVDELAELRPDAQCFRVPNGIDKEVFTAPPAGSAERGGPLRVLVEGSDRLWFKGIDDARAALAATREPIESTLVAPEAPAEATRASFDAVAGPLGQAELAGLYRDADVLLKLSRVEGVFTPPLEAFHCGAPCVVWPVTGHDEYVRHGVNGAVVDFDDIAGTAAWLDLLARDRDLLGRLSAGALETAAAWPSWERATGHFATALRAIAAAPAPKVDEHGLLRSLEAGMEDQRRAQLRLRSEADTLQRRLDAAPRPSLLARVRHKLSSR